AGGPQDHRQARRQGLRRGRGDRVQGRGEARRQPVRQALRKPEGNHETHERHEKEDKEQSNRVYLAGLLLWPSVFLSCISCVSWFLSPVGCRDMLRRYLPLILTPVALVTAGTLGYWLIDEQYTLFDSLYMTVTTLTTVGYGEVHPLTWKGRLFT